MNAPSSLMSGSITVFSIDAETGKLDAIQHSSALGTEVAFPICIVVCIGFVLQVIFHDIFA